MHQFITTWQSLAYFNCLHTSALSSWISQGRLSLAYQWDTFHGPAICQISATATGEMEHTQKMVENSEECLMTSQWKHFRNGLGF